MMYMHSIGYRMRRGRLILKVHTSAVNIILCFSDQKPRGMNWSLLLNLGTIDHSLYWVCWTLGTPRQLSPKHRLSPNNTFPALCSYVFHIYLTLIWTQQDYSSALRVNCTWISSVGIDQTTSVVWVQSGSPFLSTFTWFPW